MSERRTEPKIERPLKQEVDDSAKDWPTFSHSEPLRAMVSNQVERTERSALLKAIVASDALTLSFSDNPKAVRELLRNAGDASIHLSLRGELRELGQVGRDVLWYAREAQVALDSDEARGNLIELASAHSDRYQALVAKSAAALEQISQRAGSVKVPERALGFRSRILNAESADVETLRQVVALAQENQRSPSDPDFNTLGGFVAKQGQDRIWSFLEKGGSLLVFGREEELSGYLIYFHPNEAKGFLGADNPIWNLYQDQPHAFVHHQCVRRGVRVKGVSDSMVNAMLLDLALGEANSLLARESVNAQAVLNSNHAKGARLEPRDMVESVSESGEKGRYVGLQLLVDPELVRRRQWAADPQPPNLRQLFSDREMEQAERPLEDALSTAQAIQYLASATAPFVVRITGGCALMDPGKWQGMLDLFTEGFRGFEGALISGATRMFVSENGALDGRVRPGITEMAPHITLLAPEARLLGVVNDAEGVQSLSADQLVAKQIQWDFEAGGVKHVNDVVTAIHPDFDNLILVDASKLPADRKWDAEYLSAQQIAGSLRSEHGFRPITIAFNGGETTRREIEDADGDVIVIKGSGRVSDEPEVWELAHVHAIEGTPEALRAKLIELGALRDASQAAQSAELSQSSDVGDAVRVTT